MNRVAIGLLASCLWSALLVLGPINGKAQQRIDHQPPAGVEAGAMQELTFFLTGVSTPEVYEAVLYFRTEGELSYEQIRADVDQDEAIAELEIPDQPVGALEYYLAIDMQDGSRITYPQANPQEEPLTATIRQPQEESSEDLQVGHVDYNILSPQPGEELTEDDVMMAITLFYEDEPVNAEDFRVYFAGENVSDQASISPFFISYVPGTMRAGNYPIEVTFMDGDTEVTLAEWEFSVIDRTLAEERERRQNIPTGRVELGGRNQNVAGFQNEIFRGRLQLSGNIGDNVSYSFNGLLTNQETGRLQPRNRFGGELHISDWFRLNAGHVYPTLNSLTISGRRVYGVNAELSLFDNSFHMEGIYGNIARTVTNQYTDLQAIEGDEEPMFMLGFEQGGRGMYERRIAGGRLAFGSDERFQFGLGALKVEDDINSIDIIEEYDDLPDEKLQQLNPDQRQTLEQNPDLFQFEGNHPNPAGNFIFSSDVQASADQNRINFSTDAGLSLLNQDISNPLNQERADELGIELDSETENILDLVSTLIIINENMNARPFGFDDGEVSPRMPSEGLGLQSRLNFNYFDHNLQIQYRWIGPAYESLANSSIRRDIAGFRITDRFRALDNTLYFTLGYESLSDNVMDTRDATTDTDIYRGNISWYPVSNSLPRISFNTRYQTRDNQIDRLVNPYLDDAGIDQTRAVRNVSFADEEISIATRPRLTNTLSYGFSVSQQFELLDISHEASVNLNILNTEDEVFQYGDFSSNTLGFDISSRIPDHPMRVNLRTNFVTTESMGGLNSVNIAGFSSGGSYRFLDDQLSVRGELAFTRNEVESTGLEIGTVETDEVDELYTQYYRAGEVTTREVTNSYMFRANAQYDITPSHAIVFSVRLNNMVAANYDRNIPTESYVQLRYMFTF